ncbi:chromatin modification protein [Saccharomycopsis crataegensis]|uniref:Chromatin modification protein n=1 Tax=Saccharomycopsis crataegensis TaxID=43959 RepID=A0AAV5QT22_9ASCO|nr:chromatin modification protein [Saccharomycopsis crataegensis]
MTSQGNENAASESGDYQPNQDNVPRDVKLLHLLFAANSIDSYEDHVPLQLMDFAYRYTTGILKDAVIYSDHGNMASSNVTNAGNIGSSNKAISVEDVKLASAARSDYQFRNSQSRELLFELASEKNKKPLPNCIPSFGVRLPPEKYCFTGKDLELEDEYKYEEDIKMKSA